jgi:hypothetical protein
MKVKVMVKMKVKRNQGTNDRVDLYYGTRRRMKMKKKRREV